MDCVNFFLGPREERIPDKAGHTTAIERHLDPVTGAKMAFNVGLSTEIGAHIVSPSINANGSLSLDDKGQAIQHKITRVVSFTCLISFCSSSPIFSLLANGQLMLWSKQCPKTTFRF